MEHIDFKLKQAAAAYVAHGLNDTDMEDFEIHMMGCAECVEDIEVWRAIKQGIPKMPRQNPVEGTSRRYSRAEWPFAMAASMVGVGVISALGGWVMKGNLIPDLDSARTVVFNLPPVSRSAGECPVAHHGCATRRPCRASGVEELGQARAIHSGASRQRRLARPPRHCTLDVGYRKRVANSSS